MTDRHSRIPTNVPGLDSILGGGFLPGRSYLVTGGPGTGKTTLGLHFLADGQSTDALLISMGEADRNIRSDAKGIGLQLDHVTTIDLSPGQAQSESEPYTLLEPWEAESPDIRARVEEAFPSGPPRRVFIDALSQYRHLVPDAYQFRKQVMTLLEQLTAAGSTVLYTAERGSEADEDLQYLGDGILCLDWVESGRSLTVVKFRGSGFSEGRHTVRLADSGMTVFERLVPADHQQQYISEPLGSGVEALDALVGGGLERGTVTVISGPTGVGKTTLGVQFMMQAASRGERSVVFSFEERLGTLQHRCEHIGIPIGEMMASGDLVVEEVEALRYSADEFAWQVRREVEERGVRLLMLDSLSGFRQSIRGEDVTPRVHALCRYLSNMGVTVLLINEVGSIAGGELRVSDYGISYLADAVLLLRYIELNGEIRKTVGVLKKRTGDFEKKLREFQIDAQGIRVGQPLQGLRGILHGSPTDISRDPGGSAAE